MSGSFEQYAVQRLIDRAESVGIPVPASVQSICGGASDHGALTFAALHPDDDDPTVPDEMRWCCAGAAMRGLDSCTCWEPVYAVEQAAPVPVASPADFEVAPVMCGDCAFRKGSPERSTAYEEEALLDLAERGTPFWCHDGMRRPLEWRHPSGVTIPGDPDDWTPPKVAGIPYRADGRPGLLCNGWAHRAARKSIP